MIYFFGLFSTPSKSDLHLLVTIGGATVTSRPPLTGFFFFSLSCISFALAAIRRQLFCALRGDERESEKLYDCSRSRYFKAQARHVGI